MPWFMRSLGRVADLSNKVAQAKLVTDDPVHVAWKNKRPLILKLRVSNAEWLVLATNPWQAEKDEKVVTVRCGSASVDLTIRGKHTEIYHVANGRPKRIEMAP